MKTIQGHRTGRILAVALTAALAIVMGVHANMSEADNTKAGATSKPAPKQADLVKGDAFVALMKNLQAGKKQTIVTWGTSLTFNSAWAKQIGDYLNKEYPGQVTLINSGINGICIKNQGLPQLDDAVIKNKPDLLFFEFAINDAFQDYATPQEECRKLTNELIDRVQKALPNCQIVMQTMNPCFGDHGGARPKLADYYQVYRDVAKARKVTLVDHNLVWTWLVATDRPLFDKLVPDKLHPSAEGQLQIIWPTLEKAFQDADKKARAAAKSGK